MENLHLWVITVISAGTLVYTVVSSYAVRGNELKHLHEMVASLKEDFCKDIKEVLKRVERIENFLFKK